MGDGMAAQSSSKHLKHAGADNTKEQVCRSVLSVSDSSPYSVLGLEEGDIMASNAAVRKLRAKLHPDATMHLDMTDSLRAAFEQAWTRVERADEQLQKDHESEQKIAEQTADREALVRVPRKWKQVSLKMAALRIKSVVSKFSASRNSIELWGHFVHPTLSASKHRCINEAKKHLQAKRKCLDKWGRLQDQALRESERKKREKLAGDCKKERASYLEQVAALFFDIVGLKPPSNIVSSLSSIFCRRPKSEDIEHFVHVLHVEVEKLKEQAAQSEKRAVESETKVNCLLSDKADGEKQAARSHEHIQQLIAEKNALEAALAKASDKRVSDKERFNKEHDRVMSLVKETRTSSTLQKLSAEKDAIIERLKTEKGQLAKRNAELSQEAARERDRETFVI